MLIVISPAKTLKMDINATIDFYSMPKYLDQSQKIADTLKKKSVKKLEAIMGISTQLAQLNYERFQQWHTPYNSDNAKQAIFAFRGDVYTGLDVDNLSLSDLEYTQGHLRILSGLYGVLKPMDLILAYRLEMGTHITIGRKKNLYDFWGKIITAGINSSLEDQNDNILINLASNEYFKSIDKKLLNAQIITPVFKDFKNGEYKMISFFAKKARGMMSRYILLNKLKSIDDLKHFEEDGYFYNENLSKEYAPVFTRG